MSAWNYASIWEIVAETLPDHIAQIQGDRQLTWSEFDRRADGVAKALLEAGAQQQDKVAQYLYNCPEYHESMFAAFKAGLVPVNTNYRYADDELAYLWDNADAVAVVFHGTFADRIENVRHRVPKVKTWLWVDDGSGPCPDWADAYEDAAKSADSRTVAPWGRSADDILMMYTGGTTGLPKGVMWRQDTLIRSVNGNAFAFYREPEADYEQLRASLENPLGPLLVGCPLMHGTGQYISMLSVCGGGTVVTLVDRKFDVTELLDTVQEHSVQGLIIVGDAFAKPMVRALDEHPDRWDISSLLIVTSSGVMWSQESKDALLAHHPGMILFDAFGSSEAVGLGASISTAGGTSDTAKFTLGENAIVIADDGSVVEPGSGVRGRVAVKGYTPVGYYKDPEKSAATFVQIGDETFSIPGDYAMVEADGSLTLLGRGSVCINTGGEKVFPEEVEEALKTHPTVADAVVVGLPDEKFGEAITAVVEPTPGAELDHAELIGWVKGKLASFKAPKSVVAIDTIGRAPNGKVDYKRMKAYAADQLGAVIPA